MITDQRGSRNIPALTPEVAAYLQLVEEVVELGVNVPPPPPIAHPIHPLAPQAWLTGCIDTTGQAGQFSSRQFSDARPW